MFAVSQEATLFFYFSARALGRVYSMPYKLMSLLQSKGGMKMNLPNVVSVNWTLQWTGEAPLIIRLSLDNPVI